MHKIRQRILLITLLPSMLLLGILSIYLLQTRSSDLRLQFAERGAVLARQLAAATVEALPARDRATLQALAKGLMESRPEVRAIRFQDAEGRVLLEQGRPQGHPSIHNHFSAPVVPHPALAAYRPSATSSPLGRVELWLDPHRLLQDQRRLVTNTLILALAGLLCMAMLALFLSRRIADPLEELTRAAKALRQGKLDTRVPLAPHGELGELQQAFNDMAREIAAANKTLQERVEQATRELQRNMEILESKNAELDMARRRALEINRVKSEFLASMSHEIRTPMNGVLGFTNLLRKTPLNPVQLEYLGTIESSAKNLLTIIDDILDLSKLEAGRLSLEQAPFSLRRCIEEVISLLAPQAHQKGLELVLLIYDDVPDHLVGDRTRIAQIVTNLTNNAIKFTQEGEVVVRVMLEEEWETRVELALSVTDTGMGIHPDEQKSIFDTFTQSRMTEEGGPGGTGLGLSICKRLAEAMGGTLTLSSQPGRGSTFTARLRLALDRSGEGAVKPPPPLGKRLLLLEAHTTSRQALRGELNHLGVVVNAPECLPGLPELTPELLQGHDLAILCLGAHQIESPQLVRRIDHCLQRTTVPVAILLGSSSRDIIDDFLELGAAYCASKPIKAAALRELVETCLGRTRSQPTGLPPPKAPKWLSGKRILVADDNAINRQLIEILLLGYGATVFCAGDGKEALAIARQESLDLVMLDIHMPELDGFQVAAAIRARFGPQAPCLVAITADAMDRNRQQMERQGFDAYLLKPIDEAQLVRLLQQKLAIQEAVPPKATAPPPSAPAKPSKPPLSKSPVRDMAQALRATGGSETIADTLFSKLLLSLPGELAAIHHCFEKRDWEGLWQAVHHLQGSAAVCGIPAFSDALAHLQRCVQSQDVAATEAAIEWVERERRRLHQLDAVSLELQRQPV